MARCSTKNSNRAGSKQIMRTSTFTKKDTIKKAAVNCNIAKVHAGDRGFMQMLFKDIADGSDVCKAISIVKTPDGTIAGSAVLVVGGTWDFYNQKHPDSYKRIRYNMAADFTPEKSFEVGVYVLRKYRRMGIGTKLIKAILKTKVDTEDVYYCSAGTCGYADAFYSNYLPSEEA